MLAQFEDCTLDTASRELLYAGEPVKLEPKAFDLLVYLIENRDRAVSKNEIQDAVWDTIVTESALTRCVMKLRKALPGTAEDAIKTVPRFGYRFVAKCSFDSRTRTAPSAPGARPSIAVLPLLNLSDDIENEYFSDGLAEEILNLLARIPTLRVTSRTSAFSFKGRSSDVKTIGRDLDVDYVLEGSVRRSKNRVRIAQQLIDARTDEHIWSEIYDRELNDVFAVQAEIAEEVVGAFNVGGDGIVVRKDTDDITAYDYFLRGRHYFHTTDGGAIKRAIQMFRKAIEIDPNYARAWAGLAYALTWSAMWFDGDKELLENAMQAGVTATDIAPDLADSHVARGFSHSLVSDYDAAAKHFDEALRLDPILYEASYLYARSRFAQGMMPEAAELFERAADVRREDYQALCLAVQPYEVMGDMETARDVADRAVIRCRRNIELRPEDTRAWTLGAGALITLGATDEAMRWVEEALAIAPDDIGVLHNSGCCYAEIGEIDKALDTFEKRFSLGKVHKDWIDNDPSFDSIREHPRFKAMLRT